MRRQGLLGLCTGFWVAISAWACPSGADADIVSGLHLETPEIGSGLAYSVYLPPEHDDGRRFPVVYLLHGLGASAREWTDTVGIEAAMDRLVAAGTIAPMIIVMPDAGRSWYVDSARFGGPGNFETAIVRDLVAHVDARYPTRAGARHRGIAGYSMGGHGALRLAFRTPGTFSAVVAFAPAIWKPGGVSARGAPTEFLSPDALERWFPNTTGRTFDPAVLAEQSPFSDVGALARLEDPPRVMLAVGDADHFDFHDGTVEMYLDLRRIGMAPALRVTGGGHDAAFLSSVLGDALAFLSAELAGEP